MSIANTPVPVTAHRRRTDYRKHRRQDRWMVPLLANAIESNIVRYANEFPKPAMCLDVGCGEQPLRSRLEALQFTYCSLDMEQNTTGTVEHIGYIDQVLPDTIMQTKFDFIVCTEVLEHVAMWPSAFANLTALLKPGGRLLITCPHIWLPHEEPNDFFRPTNWALEYHAKSAGLNTLYLQRLGDGYDVLGTVLAAVRIQAPRAQPWMWLIAGPLSLLRKLALTLLSVRAIRRFINLPTTLYLSTVAVFEKPL